MPSLLRANLSDRVSATGEEPGFNRVQADGGAARQNTHKHTPQAEAQRLSLPVVLPPVLAHCIIKPNPLRSRCLSQWLSFPVSPEQYWDHSPSSAIKSLDCSQCFRKLKNKSTLFLSLIHTCISFPSIIHFLLKYQTHRSFTHEDLEETLEECKDFTCPTFSHWFLSDGKETGWLTCEDGRITLWNIYFIHTLKLSSDSCSLTYNHCKLFYY